MAGQKFFCRCRKCFSTATDKRKLLSKSQCNVHIAKHGLPSAAEIEEFLQNCVGLESNVFDSPTPPNESAHTSETKAASKGRQDEVDLEKNTEQETTAVEKNTSADVDREGAVTHFDVDAECGASSEESAGADDTREPWADHSFSQDFTCGSEVHEESGSDTDEDVEDDEEGYKSEDSELWESDGESKLNPSSHVEVQTRNFTARASPNCKNSTLKQNAPQLHKYR